MAEEDKVILDSSKLPPNSNKSKEPKEKKEIVPVVKGKVVKRKPSIFKRIGDTFIAEDVEDVKSYLLFDVLLPAVKDTIVEMGKSAIDMIFYGDASHSKSKSKNKPYRVSYSSYYEDRDTKRKHRDRENRTSTHDFDDIVLESRGEAETVLDQLCELIVEYGQATVSDFYDLVGIADNFTDNNYGWTSLEKSSVSRTRDGYIINLPRPELLD